MNPISPNDREPSMVARSMAVAICEGMGVDKTNAFEWGRAVGTAQYILRALASPTPQTEVER